MKKKLFLSFFNDVYKKPIMKHNQVGNCWEFVLILIVKL